MRLTPTTKPIAGTTTPPALAPLAQPAQRYFLADGGSIMLGGDMLELDAQTLSAYARALESFGLT